MQLLIDGESIGRLEDISSLPYSIDVDDVALDPLAPYIRTLAHAGELTVSLSPWRIPNGLMASVEHGKVCEMVILMPFRPAWWGRLKNELLDRVPPPAPISFHGTVKTVVTPWPSQAKPLQIEIRVTGPVDIADPRSRLEVKWDRVCQLLRSGCCGQPFDKDEPV